MTTPNIDTKALRELEAKATKGPWIASGFGGVQMDGYRDKYEVISEPHDSELFKVCWMRSWDGESRVTAHNNASLVAALRNAAPALLDLAERAQEQAKEIEQYTEACARAADEIGRRMYVEDKLTAERDALKAEVERLREALKAAATSLQTIGRDAGRDEYMDSLTETRVYAASRSRVAFSALRGEEAPRE